jgi:DNA-binding MarR family transcriptional regulator
MTEQLALDVDEGEVSAVLAAARALVGVAAQSIAAVERIADVLEIRVLVVVSQRGAASLREVADGLDLHMSTASRLCDRMVAARFLERRDDPNDRRQLALRLAPRGRRVVNRVGTRRREAVLQILSRMSADERAGLGEALSAFARAAGEVDDRDLWAVGWAG